MLCELLIVNNASTDGTYAAIIEEWQRYKTAVSLRIVNEYVPGLSNSRKKGFEEATYDYVVWCDDDNWLSSNYLVIAKAVFDNKKNIGVIGGFGNIHCEVPCPDWLQFENLYALGKQGTRSGPLKSKRVYGAGAIIYKPAYEKIVAAGFEQLLTDRIGTNLSSGGDYEICYAIALAGYTIWYEEKLVFTHYFPASRLTKTHYIQLINESVTCLTTLDAYNILLHGKNINKYRFWHYLIKHFFYFSKELLRYFTKVLLSNSQSGYGFFVRTRARFFLRRTAGLLSDLKKIYVNTKKLEKLEDRLRSSGQLKTNPANLLTA